MSPELQCLHVFHSHSLKDGKIVRAHIGKSPGKDNGLTSAALAVQGEVEKVMLHWL